MAKAPKTLKQQYNSLRRKAEKMLALPENAGRGIKLPKVPKRITRKSVARMEDFNESIRQPNFMRRLRRQERRKEALARWRENLQQNPEAYAEFIRKRSEASKKYWAELKRNRPEEFASRIRKMQEASVKSRSALSEQAKLLREQRKAEAKIQKDLLKADPDFQRKLHENRSKASKQYWDKLKTENSELYKQRIEALQKGRMEGLKKYREKMRKLKTEDPEQYQKLTEKSRQSRSEASKKYWDKLREEQPEIFQERINKLQEGRKKSEADKLIQKLNDPNQQITNDELLKILKNISSVNDARKKELSEEWKKALAEGGSVDEILKKAQQEIDEDVGFPFLTHSFYEPPLEGTENLESLSSDENIEAIKNEIKDTQIPISETDDIYEQFDDLTKQLAKEAEITTTGFAPGEKIDFGSGYDMGDEFELSPFEAVMVDRIYAQNFDQRFADFQHTSAKDMVELFQNALADELNNMDEVRYIIAKSIENGDLEFSWGAHGDSTAKEIAEKMISALNKWITHQDPEFIVRHLGFNKEDFINKIQQIADDLDSGSPDWMVAKDYDVGYWE